MYNEAGKGSRPRPFSVSQEEYDTRWEAIFGRDNKETKKPEPPAAESDNKSDSEKPE